jgi:hypothetical protein
MDVRGLMETVQVAPVRVHALVKKVMRLWT